MAKYGIGLEAKDRTTWRPSSRRSSSSLAASKYMQSKSQIWGRDGKTAAGDLWKVTIKWLSKLLTGS